MNVNLSNIFVNHSFLMTNFSQALTTQHKKIIAIALIAIGFMMISFACCLPVKKKDQKIQAVPEKPAKFNTEKIVGHLKRAVSEASNDKIQLVSAKLFMKINFANSEIKKEFIIKDLTTADVLDKEALKIKNYVEGQITDKLGSYQKMQLSTLFNDTKGQLHQWSDDESEENSAGKSESHSGRSNCSYMDANTLAIYYKEEIVKSMEFPREPQYKNGEFIAGSLYVSL